MFVYIFVHRFGTIYYTPYITQYIFMYYMNNSVLSAKHYKLDFQVMLVTILWGDVAGPIVCTCFFSVRYRS